MTTMPGVFIAGDARHGNTAFVVDAIGEGHKVARCIDRYLRGPAGIPEPHRLPLAKLDKAEIYNLIAQGIATDRPRAKITTMPSDERIKSFAEVDLPMTEGEALAEAERCLRCGICSECLECLAACERGAINHDMQDELLDDSPLPPANRTPSRRGLTGRATLPQ